MVATIILAVIIFGYVGYLVVNRIQKKRNGGGGCNCSDCSCGPAPKKR